MLLCCGGEAILPANAFHVGLFDDCSCSERAGPLKLKAGRSQDWLPQGCQLLAVPRAVVSPVLEMQDTSGGTWSASRRPRRPGSAGVRRIRCWQVLAMKFPVTAAFGIKGIVAPSFDDPSVLNDKNLVRHPDGREAMGAYECRSTGHQPGQSILDYSLRFAVEV